MGKSCFNYLSATAILLASITWAIAAPTQLQGEIVEVDPLFYAQPELAEALARHYESLGDTEPQRFDGIGGGHLLRQNKRGLDSLSGATFGENKRFDSLSGIAFGNQKRNFDEFDRSGYDNFPKKTIDEISSNDLDSFAKRTVDEFDRPGWGGFVKRRLLDAYLLENKQH